MNTGILDRPIAFHRCFVTLTGSVNAALMLSQAIYWQKRNQDEAWWFQSREKWEDETGLSRDEQETARKKLRKLSFWKEDLRGVPAKLYYHVDLDSLMDQLNSLPTSRVQPTHPVGCIPANKEGAFPPSTNKEKRLNEETKELRASLPIPTMEEVLQRASEKSIPEIEAEQFFYHYDSIGWKVGQSQMKNWKSALSGWNLRSKKFDQKKRGNPIAERIDIQKRIESVVEQIKEHPGNPEWIGYNDNTVTQDDKDSLRSLRVTLKTLRDKQNTIATG